MEKEGLDAHGVTIAGKEIDTVKSDHTNLKADFLEQLISTGEYHLPKDIKYEGETKKVVKVYLEMLRD